MRWEILPPNNAKVLRDSKIAPKERPDAPLHETAGKPTLAIQASISLEETEREIGCGEVAPLVQAGGIHIPKAISASRRNRC